MPYQLNGKITHGEEYNGGEPIEGAFITHGVCQYCGVEIIQVKDDYLNGRFGALGNQAVRAGTYFGSRTIQKIKEFYKVGWKDLETKEVRENGAGFTQELGNNLYNSHSVLHVHKPGSRKLIGPWMYANHNSFKVLCNNCFQKTYKRVSVKSESGLIYDVTVLPGQNLRQVLKDIGVNDAIL